MMDMNSLTAEQVNALFYDASVPEDFWEGELDFYRELLVPSALIKTHGVLELGCGTGRICLALAREGITFTGLDLSEELLQVARSKSVDMRNMQWVQGDMQTFELGTRYGCVLIPAHSFQFMLSPEDQMQCLRQIKKHLMPGGLVVIHLDPPAIDWMADLVGPRQQACETGSILTHTATGGRFRQTAEWTYEPSTQTFTCRNDWHRVDESGNILQTWHRSPMRFHSFFRYEMEHLLKRAGFSVEALWGDFHRNEFGDGSPHAIWIAMPAEES